jgi:hypothetical protein
MLGEYLILPSALYALLSEVVVLDRFEVSVIAEKFCESLVSEVPQRTNFLELSTVWQEMKLLLDPLMLMLPFIAT